MGINQYEKAKRMLETLKKEKGNTIAFDDFIFAMKIYISNDKYRTQKPYFELMKETKLIEETTDGRIRIK